MPKRWLVKGVALNCYVRGYHIYKGIRAAATGEVLACSREPTNVGKIFIVKLYSHKFFCMFSVYENIFTMKKSELRYSDKLMSGFLKLKHEAL